MSREIKRVPLDFSWPRYRQWWGYVQPDKFDEYPCDTCQGRGYSQAALALFDTWYGTARFAPHLTESAPFTPDHPIIRRKAEWNVDDAPDFYGRDLLGRETAVCQEARRLAAHFNRSWSHHLNQVDVDALLAADRLWDFTRVFSVEHRWQRCLPGAPILAAAVNEWSLTGFGHDSSNAAVCVRARCEAAGVPSLCDLCKGDGSFQVYAGQREEAEAWTHTEPPAGEGWQAWETTSQGSPISPVFATAEDLATWWSDPDRSNPDRGDRYAKDWMPYPAAHQFILRGYSAGTLVTVDGQTVSGHEYVGTAEPDETGNL